VLLCERTYLVQLVKGLIEKLMPTLLEDSARPHQAAALASPKFFNDPFLERQYSKPAIKVPVTTTAYQN